MYFCIMTSLFHDIIFGPVHSRRLGLSLGGTSCRPIRKPARSTASTANAAGTPNTPADGDSTPVKMSARAMKRRCAAWWRTGTPPDVITFAGNGEPTLASRIRSGDRRYDRPARRMCPSAKVSVLSTPPSPPREEVRRALLRVDNNILARLRRSTLRRV